MTQATLSRDIRELGLVKGGPTARIRRSAAVEANGHTREGDAAARAGVAAAAHRSRAAAGAAAHRARARAVALRALDGAGLPDVVGTLAGEDTILIITPDARRARTLVKRLEEMSNA